MSKIVTQGGGGVTSCLGVRLHDALEFYGTFQVLPDQIDSSGQFLIYRDFEGQNIADLIIGQYTPNNALKHVPFKMDWQFRWYDEIKLDDLAKLAENICPVSSFVGNKAYQFKEKVEGRTAILYRGNDKVLDTPRTHYQGMVILALESESDKFIVQTDENNFYNFFKERFPDTICLDELPRIDKDPDSYVMPPLGGRAEFCINFVAALKALSQAPKVILNTGNTGLWLMLFRGHTENVWQINAGMGQAHRKLT